MDNVVAGTGVWMDVDGDGVFEMWLPQFFCFLPFLSACDMYITLL